jgi:3-deoxy-D-manno-octulosonate 8-phosphate phosphatase (KDO 8-P phosphatase)
LKDGNDIVERAGRVRLVLLDVDGVLTDGGIHMSPDGDMGRTFHTRDGLGVRLGQRGGLRFGVISGRRSEAVTRRLEELDFVEVHQGIRDKVECFEGILSRVELKQEAVCFVGDDLVDVPVMRRAGLAVAPADAAPEVRAIAHMVTEQNGGRGAVREVVDFLLRASGNWDRVTDPLLK